MKIQKTKRTVRAPKSEPFRADYLAQLRDPAFAAEFLNAVLRDGDLQEMLNTIRDLAEANGGMAALADKAKLKRQSVYKMLSQAGNPSIHNFDSILLAMGLRLSIAPAK